METTLIQGGTVYDGTGGTPYPADVLMVGDTIAAIEPGGAVALSDSRILDAHGLAVAPGFIDAHSHAEFVIAEENHLAILTPFLLQGITTAIGGNCGFSPFPVTDSNKETVLENSRFLTNDDFAFHWRDQPGFFDYLKNRGICLNLATMAGHGPLRSLIKGSDTGPMDEGEREQLAGLLEQAFANGAYGTSLGLSYVPGIFADDAEIETVFAAAARANALVTIHGRTYSRTSPCFPDDTSGTPHNLLDMASYLAVAAKTGAKVHISHVLLKGTETWDLWQDTLALFDRAKADGVDITFGVIPYHCGNTLITTLFPKWFLEDFSANMVCPDQVQRLETEVYATEKAIGRDFSNLFLLWGVNPALSHLEGKSFSQIAQERGIREIDTCLYLAKESGGRAKVLTTAYSGKEDVYPEPLEHLLKHPLALVEIDAILTSATGPQIPASFGAFPKWLGHYSRERGLMPMEQAVRRLTGAPADRFGLRRRGYLRKNYAADVTIFDPETIKDINSIANPTTSPRGIAYVFINGRLVVSRGNVCDNGLHGLVLQSNM